MSKKYIKLKDAVNNLYNNLIDAETTNYMETFEENDPNKKSINQLKESTYKDLRVLELFSNIDFISNYIVEKDIEKYKKLFK